MNVQKIPKLVPIPKKKVPRKKMILVKDKVKKLKKLKKWLDGEVLHLIALRGGMELEFAIIAKKKQKIKKNNHLKNHEKKEKKTSKFNLILSLSITHF